jgi:hypothetical protein
MGQAIMPEKGEKGGERGILLGRLAYTNRRERLDSTGRFWWLDAGLKYMKADYDN